MVLPPDMAWIFGLGIGGFLLLYPISLMKRDSSIVDFWWGPGFGILALACWAMLGAPMTTSALVLLIPVVLWAGRLGIHLGYRRISEGREDARYSDLAGRFQPGWWWKRLFVVFLLQGVLQSLIAAPVLVALVLSVGEPLTALHLILAAIAIAAIGIQALSDWQLDRFRRSAEEGAILTTGLRAIVRHPSYSAEIVFWMCIGGIVISLGNPWGILPPAMMLLLLRYVSGVTVIGDRMRARPGYASYERAVPALVPGWQPEGTTGNLSPDRQ